MIDPQLILKELWAEYKTVQFGMEDGTMWQTGYRHCAKRTLIIIRRMAKEMERHPLKKKRT